MRIAFSGSRNIDDVRAVESIIGQYIAVKDVVITGGCRGVDRIVHGYARRYFVDTEVYEADWDNHGKAAGPIRNKLMAGKCDALVAIWDGKSRGTKNMIDECLRRGVETHIFFLEAKP